MEVCPPVHESQDLQPFLLTDGPSHSPAEGGGMGGRPHGPLPVKILTRPEVLDHARRVAC